MPVHHIWSWTYFYLQSQCTNYPWKSNYLSFFLLVMSAHNTLSSCCFFFFFLSMIYSETFRAMAFEVFSDWDCLHQISKPVTTFRSLFKSPSEKWLPWLPSDHPLLLYLSLFFFVAHTTNVMSVCFMFLPWE